MKKGIPFNVGDREPHWDSKANQPDFEAIQSKLGPEPKPSTQPSATRHLLLILGGVAAAVIAFFTFSKKEIPPVDPHIAEVAQTVSLEEASGLSNEWQALPSTFSIDSQKDNFLQTEDGVGLSIPAAAFGEAIDSAQVEISFYNDAFKVFASGIPMTYDSAGVTYHFMSDGMLEIRAYAKGSPLALAGGKALQLEIPARQDSLSFNAYALDDENEAWIYQESLPCKSYAQVCSDRMVQFLPAQEVAHQSAIAETQRELDMLSLEARKLQVEAPFKPHQRNPIADHFTLDFLASEYPALSAFEGLEFEVRGRGFALDAFERTWDDIHLERVPGSDQFEVTLVDAKREQTFKVLPVYVGEAFDEAMKQYESALTEHQIKTNHCESTQAAKQNILDVLNAQVNKDRLTAGQRSSEIFSNLVEDMDTKLPYRQFKVNSLGIFNADLAFKLYKAPAIPVDVVAHFQGDHIRPAKAILTDVDRMAFYTLTGQDLQDLRFDRKRDHYLFATIDKGRKLCYVGPEALSALEKKSELLQVLELQLVEEPVTSFEEFLAQIEEPDS